MPTRHLRLDLGLLVLMQVFLPCLPASAGEDPVTDWSGEVVSLDGTDWWLAPDPGNTGRQERWFEKPRDSARQAKVPWIIQDAFPGYHGVAWYWREFTPPRNAHPHGRYLLRFWAVDYLAEVWLNDTYVGKHEGGESPFLLDVTETLQPGKSNRLAVRVLNPTHEPIDGIVLLETPHRNKALPYAPGSAWDQGGIMDSVELLVVPGLRIDDLFVRPDPKSGLLRVQCTLMNTTGANVSADLEIIAAPATSGETVAAAFLSRGLPAGETKLETQVAVSGWRLWELNDPFLYRVTARLSVREPAIRHERSVRCGFRDFRFENGAFRLNGRRVYLRCSHTGNCCPIGLELPHDPDFLRRDLINAKMMGFNAIRFIAGVPKRSQLDLCDEIGLMVYEEPYAAWCLADSPRMADRYDESVLSMVQRDRNHPCVTIWGLLNETPDGPVFRHAASLLPSLRQLDDSRLVLLNSGRWDAQSASVEGIEVWRNVTRVDPCVTHNPTDRTIKALGITWSPGQLAAHPGRDGEFGVVRWTAPATETVGIAAEFSSIAEQATTDVHVLHNGRPLFDGYINVQGGGPAARFEHSLSVTQGDTLDLAVGYGNGHYGADTTAVAVRITTAAGIVHDAARDFSADANPHGAWTFGQMAPGPAPRAETFAGFASKTTEKKLGTLSNPGTTEWQDLLDDQHPYQRVPHTADIVQRLRTIDGKGRPLFISEYGIGSSIDLMRTVAHYERLGKTDVEDAQLYRTWRDQFLADYERWQLREVFPRPEDFFAASNARMAGQRLLGINAIRANPNCVGYSLTGTVDQGMTAEGLWTTFRELKPGTADAVFEGFAPLRLCLFTEPLNLYRGAKVRLEARLANEDALLPGDYPVRMQVVAPDLTCVLDRSVTVTIPESLPGREPPFVQPVFDEEVVVDGPAGSYRFLATFTRGAAAAGGEANFFVADRAEMPPVAVPVSLWGTDEGLADWLTANHITSSALPSSPNGREVILACGTPPAEPRAALVALAQRVARGSTVVFLSPSVVGRENQPTAFLPLANKGTIAALPAWLYHKDDWAKQHPVFEGLPSGGLLDYAFYRELIPDIAFVGQEPPAQAIAGAINATIGYSSGLHIAEYPFGAGRCLINTLRIRENLSTHPAAERLLRNMLRYAAQDVQQPLAELPADFEQQLQAIGY